MQTRFFCQECTSQWVYAMKDDGHCPKCGSEQIGAVTYRPDFPGADYRSEGVATVATSSDIATEVQVAPTDNPFVTPPPLTLIPQTDPLVEAGLI